MAARTFFTCSIFGCATVFTDIHRLRYVVVAPHGVLPFSGQLWVVINELISHLTPGARLNAILINSSAVSAKFHLVDIVNYYWYLIRLC